MLTATIIKIELYIILLYLICNMVLAIYLIIKEKSIIKLIDDKFDRRLVITDGELFIYNLSIKDYISKFIIMLLILPNVIIMALVELIIERGTK